MNSAIHRVPVRYVDIGGIPRPLIKCTVGFDRSMSWRVNGEFPGPSEVIEALVDTGSDINFFDEAVLKKCGCERKNERAEITSAHGTKRWHNTYKLDAYFHEGPLAFTPAAAAEDMSTSHYKAILGTMFLRYGRLVIEPEGESYFEVIWPPAGAQKA